MRPIDGDTVDKVIYEEIPLAYFWGRSITSANKNVAAIRGRIAQIPTLDVVPVIRCTECKYSGPGDHAGFWRCENWGVDINRQASPPETFYCADAEKRI